MVETNCRYECIACEIVNALVTVQTQVHTVTLLAATSIEVLQLSTQTSSFFHGTGIYIFLLQQSKNHQLIRADTEI